MPRSPWLAAALCLPAGCFSSPDPQQVQGAAGCSTAACRGSTGRPQGGVSGTDVSGTGGTTTGPAGGTGGATTGGSSGGGACGACYDQSVPVGQFHACQGTPPCANAIRAQVCDVLQRQAVCGMTVQELDSSGIAILGQGLSTTTDSTDGTFQLCPASVPFTVAASGSGCQETYSAQLVAGGLNVPSYFSYGYGNLFPVFSTTEFDAIAQAFQAGNTQSSLISVSVSSGCEPVGFRISAELPDGGALQAQTQYVHGDIPNTSLTETDDGGSAIVTLDPSQTHGLVALVATPVDVPSGCPTKAAYASYGMTGLVYVTPGSYTSTTVPVQ